MVYKVITFRCPFCKVSKENNKDIIKHIFDKHRTKIVRLLTASLEK